MHKHLNTLLNNSKGNFVMFAIFSDSNCCFSTASFLSKDEIFIIYQTAMKTIFLSRIVATHQYKQAKNKCYEYVILKCSISATHSKCLMIILLLGIATEPMKFCYAVEVQKKQKTAISEVELVVH